MIISFLKRCKPKSASRLKINEFRSSAPLLSSSPHKRPCKTWKNKQTGKLERGDDLWWFEQSQRFISQRVLVTRTQSSRIPSHKYVVQLQSHHLPTPHVHIILHLDLQKQKQFLVTKCVVLPRQLCFNFRRRPVLSGRLIYCSFYANGWCWMF